MNGLQAFWIKDQEHFTSNTCTFALTFCKTVIPDVDSFFAFSPDCSPDFSPGFSPDFSSDFSPDFSPDFFPDFSPDFSTAISVSLALPVPTVLLHITTYEK